MGDKPPLCHFPPESVSHASGQLRVKGEENGGGARGRQRHSHRLAHARSVRTDSGVTLPCPQGQPVRSLPFPTSSW